MSPINGEKAPSGEEKKSALKTFLTKLRKRHIIETLAAFIAGGWLFLEFVDRILIAHYELNKQWLDVSFVSLLGALLCIILWRWFSGTEKRPGNVKLEVLLVPMIILVTLAIDLNLILQIAGIPGKKLLIGIVAFLLGIAWVIFKLSRWAAGTPVSGIKKAEARPGKSIVVLPFKNMSADPEQEYFCEGIAEELTNALTQVKELRVAARTSAFSFKGKDADIREIGRTLNVDKALEGSVRKSGQRLRITAQLVNVEDGFHIWSDQFDRDMADIFTIQEEISLIVVEKLKVKLLKEEKEKLVKRSTDDHEAFDLYLKGRYFWYRRYEKGMQRGLQYFQQAIEKDPGYALAHVGIADSFGQLGLFGFMPPDQAYPRAKEAVKKALEIDPELAEVYASLGWIAMWYDWDWAAAERHFLKAIQKKPDYALAHLWYGLCLSFPGRFDQAIRETQVARELEPLEPINCAVVGLALFIARRYDESIWQLRNVIESDPEFSLAYWYQSGNFIAKKMWGEAISTLQKLVQLSAGSAFALGSLGMAYGWAGMKDEAFKILEQLDRQSKDRYVPSFYRALVWLGLGEKNEALENLEKAYLERESLMAYLKTWPLFDSVRSEPRFKELLPKIGLEK